MLALLIVSIYSIPMGHGTPTNGQIVDSIKMCVAQDGVKLVSVNKNVGYHY